MDAKTVIERNIIRAQNTWIFEHPDHEHYVVLSHPGQPAPPKDPAKLREDFGIVPADHRHIKRLSESEKHRPRTLAEIATERAGDKSKRITELKNELAQLLAADAEDAATLEPDVDELDGLTGEEVVVDPDADPDGGAGSHPSSAAAAKGSRSTGK